MSTPIERLRSEARALDPQLRAELALDLLESLEPGDGAAADVERAWNLEAAERLATHDAGTAGVLSAADVHGNAPSGPRSQ